LPYLPTGSAQTISSNTNLNGSGLTPVGNTFHYIVDNSSNTSTPATTSCTGNGKNRICTNIPATPAYAVTVNPPSGNSIFVYNQVSTVGSSFPRPTDIQSSDGKYRYIIPSLELGNSSVTINSSSDPDTNNSAPNNGVEFHLTGNIAFSGNGGISHSCSGGASVQCSNKFIIYGHASSGTACLKGTSDVYARILAPNYDFSQTGNASIQGSVFGRSWGKLGSCSASGNQLAVAANGNWDELPDSMQPGESSMQLPRMNGISSYRNKAAN
jgi:hypothetical protein